MDSPHKTYPWHHHVPNECHCIIIPGFTDALPSCLLHRYLNGLLNAYFGNTSIEILFNYYTLNTIFVNDALYFILMRISSTEVLTNYFKSTYVIWYTYMLYLLIRNQFSVLTRSKNCVRKFTMQSNKDKKIWNTLYFKLATILQP